MRISSYGVFADTIIEIDGWSSARLVIFAKQPLAIIFELSFDEFASYSIEIGLSLNYYLRVLSRFAYYTSYGYLYSSYTHGSFEIICSVTDQEATAN